MLGALTKKMNLETDLHIVRIVFENKNNHLQAKKRGSKQILISAAEGSKPVKTFFLDCWTPEH
jgi:hypothetical protein